MKYITGTVKELTDQAKIGDYLVKPDSKGRLTRVGKILRLPTKTSKLFFVFVINTCEKKLWRCGPTLVKGGKERIISKSTWAKRVKDPKKPTRKSRRGAKKKT